MDEVLKDQPFRFEFFQAVGLLHRLAPDRDRVGYDADPTDEVVRFRSLPSLEFPASQLAELRPPQSGEGPQELTVAFFGLFGLNGGLPHHYTEWIHARGRRDRTLRDFLDIFNHRLIAQFYRAWEKYHFLVPAEQVLQFLRRESDPQRRRAFVHNERPRRDRFSQVLLDLAGLGGFNLRYDPSRRRELVPRTSIADDTVRFFSGLLAQRHRSAAALESLLSGYFGMPIRVQQLCGQWLMLDDADLSRFDEPSTCRLGVTAVVGSRIWDVQGKFRIHVGPLTFQQYRDLLPIGSAHRVMKDLGRLYAGAEFDFDLQLQLKASEVPRAQLGNRGEDQPLLGWTSWCRSTSAEHEDRHVVLSIDGP